MFDLTAIREQTARAKGALQSARTFIKSLQQRLAEIGQNEDPVAAQAELNTLASELGAEVDNISQDIAANP